MSPVSSPKMSTMKYSWGGKGETEKEDEGESKVEGVERHGTESPASPASDQPVSPCVPYITSRSRINALPQTQLEVLSKIFPAYPTDLLQITLMESRGSVSQAVERVLYGSVPRTRHGAPFHRSQSSAFKETERHECGLATLSTLSTLVRYCNRCGYRAFAADNFCSACGCILRRC